MRVYELSAREEERWKTIQNRPPWNGHVLSIEVGNEGRRQMQNTHSSSTEGQKQIRLRCHGTICLDSLSVVITKCQALVNL